MSAILATYRPDMQLDRFDMAWYNFTLSLSSHNTSDGKAPATGHDVSVIFSQYSSKTITKIANYIIYDDVY